MILWLFVGALVVLMLGWLITPNAERTDEASADEIVKRRYARGEIDRETYERMMRDLHSDASSLPSHHTASA